MWTDATLTAWPANDFRIWVGNLGNEVQNDTLARAFSKFPSFAMARVVRMRGDGASRGFGFVSFLDPLQGLRAMREMHGKYIGTHPVTLRRAATEARDVASLGASERREAVLLHKVARQAAKIKR
jgi:hypothetical protein